MPPRLSGLPWAEGEVRDAAEDCAKWLEGVPESTF